MALSLGSASAQPDAAATQTAARTLGYAGVAAYQAGDYATATDKLEQSFELVQIPSLGLWSARALVKVGKWVEAAERYGQVTVLPLALGDAAIQQSAKEDAERERAELMPRIPSLSIRIVGVAPAEVEVKLDGALVDAARVAEQRALNPGRHEVTGQYVSKHGQERTSAALTSIEGQHDDVILSFIGSANRISSKAAAADDAAVNEPPQPTPTALGSESASADGGMHRAWRTAGWISLGAGGVGFLTGLVAYAIGRAKDPGCPNNECDPRVQTEVDRYTLVRTANLAGLIAGSVFSAAGVTLLIVTEVSRNEVALRVGPGSAMLVGSF